MKDSQINNLTTQLNFIGTSGKKLVDFDNIMVVNFISSDQSVNCGIKCLKTDTLAEVEEKLYQKYEEFRENNNNLNKNILKDENEKLKEELDFYKSENENLRDEINKLKDDNKKRINNISIKFLNKKKI